MTRSFAHAGSQYRVGDAATINGQRRVHWQRWRLTGGAYVLDCGAWLPWRSTRRDIIDMLC
jgi:hypothetical protein